ncbi:MAG: M20/M25/M40 family metallo-hydrolase [Gemmatimonadota bacterium]
MASISPTEIPLLEALVATPSVSGTEERLGRLIERIVRGWGLEVSRDETGVRVEVRGMRPGPTLAFVSHLDVVPPGEGWTRDPFTPVIEDGRLYGRGSGDAKASVAAMLCAAWDCAQAGLEAGRLVVLLGYGEETKHTTMGAMVQRVGRVDAALVGEPTNLDLSIAQRGLMMVDLVARGDQRHAGYAATDGACTNAVVRLAADLVKLHALCQDRPHPVLGQVTITPTMVEAGISRNVTPPVAKAVLDIRSTPAWTHEEIADVLRASLDSEVVVTSTRLVPCETPTPSRLLEVCRAVRPTATPYGSPTCSDWVFVRDADAIKVGPGTSRRSHTADECVDLPEVTEARAFYANVAREYLR